MSAARRSLVHFRSEYPAVGEYPQQDGCKVVIERSESAWGKMRVRRIYPHGREDWMNFDENWKTAGSDVKVFEIGVDPKRRAVNAALFASDPSSNMPTLAKMTPLPGRPNSENLDLITGRKFNNRQEYESYLKKEKLSDHQTINDITHEVSVRKGIYENYERIRPKTTVRIDTPEGAATYTPIKAAKFTGFNVSPVKETDRV